MLDWGWGYICHVRLGLGVYIRSGLRVYIFDFMAGTFVCSSHSYEYIYHTVTSIYLSHSYEYVYRNISAGVSAYL